MYLMPNYYLTSHLFFGEKAHTDFFIKSPSDYGNFIQERQASCKIQNCPTASAVGQKEDS
jgi:hypothetical protein